jgi:hypothetical protein
METEEQRLSRRRVGRRTIVGACLVLVLLGSGVALATRPWSPDPPCDKFAQVAITYGGTSDVGAGWEEAILIGLRSSDYFGQYPGVSEDDVLSAMPDPPTGEGATVTLDLDGEPSVNVRRAGNGWRAGEASFCL